MACVRVVNHNLGVSELPTHFVEEPNVYAKFVCGQELARRPFEELNGRIVAKPASAERRKIKGVVSFSDKTMVTFPKKKKEKL